MVLSDGLYHSTILQAQANSFFGHDAKHAAMAKQEIKNSQGKFLSFHSAAYGKSHLLALSQDDTMMPIRRCD